MPLRAYPFTIVRCQLMYILQHIQRESGPRISAFLYRIQTDGTPRSARRSNTGRSYYSRPLTGIRAFFTVIQWLRFRIPLASRFSTSIFPPNGNIVSSVPHRLPHTCRLPLRCPCSDHSLRYTPYFNILV